ncbi:MAG: hypothetical protein FD180_4927 [Planctomycetota bacterium]|nr:MAG: hypothetical protein FD180_4927 [Planctomycetota bacterium]
MHPQVGSRSQCMAASRFNARVRPPIGEHAYLFRHALLRDAAYQLQLPGDRARLHGLAFEVIEALAGGRPPEPPPLEPYGAGTSPLPGDAFALELSEHARLAQDASGADGSPMLNVRKLYLRRAAAYAALQFQFDESARLLLQLAGLVSGNQKGECLRCAAEATDRSGRPHAAEPLYVQAVALHREEGDRRLEAIALSGLADLYDVTGRVAEAESGFDRSLAMLREAGDKRGQGVTQGSLAGLYRQTGRFELSERMYEEALATHRESGNRRAEGATLGNLAALYLFSGRVAESESAIHRALSILRESGDRRGEGVAIGNLSALFGQLGRFDEAARGFQAALEIHRDVGNRRAEGNDLTNLGTLLLQTGRPDKSEHAYGQAITIHREVGNRRQEGAALSNLAGLYFEAGRYEESESAYQQALPIHRGVADRRFEGINLCGSALVVLLRGEACVARERWREGAAILRELGDLPTLDRKLDVMRRTCKAAGAPPFDEPSL